MKKSIVRNVVCVAAAGLLVLWFQASITAQGASQQPAPGKQADVSDQDLKAFAEAYAAYHRIRLAYESSVKNVQDPDKSKKLQAEANSKIEKVLKEQGPTVENYNQIFAAANANEALRKKTLKLIEEERKRS